MVINSLVTVCHGMDTKGHSDEVLMEMRNILLESGGKAILVIKWQRASLKCVHVLEFCGRQNL